MKRTLMVLALVVVASGCTLGPNYQRPQVAVPEAWRSAPTTDADAANAEWWRVYQDPALEELIRIAVAENRDLRIAMERVNEARSRYGVARSTQWPQVNASGAAGWNDPGEALGGSDTLYTVGADLSWEIDFFGSLRRSNEAAWASYLSTDHARRAATLTLAYSVARAWFELRDLDRQVEITTRTLESRRQARDLVKALFEGGVRSEIDFRQAEGEYYSVAISLRNLERQVVAKENELSILLGRMPGKIERAAAPSPVPVVSAIPAGLPSDLLERRPDVLAAEQQLVAANAQIGVAKAALFPRIALTGTVGGASADLSDMLDSSSITSNLLANIFQPVFNGGRLRRNVEVTEAIQRQALSGYEQAVFQAFREVEDALATYRKTAEQAEAHRARVESLREVLRLNELSYEGGVADYLRVLDAQRSLYSAELQAAQNERDERVALAAVYKALGGGWSSEKVEGK